LRKTIPCRVTKDISSIPLLTVNQTKCHVQTLICLI
jgi:hypothetical protein